MKELSTYAQYAGLGAMMADIPSFPGSFSGRGRVETYRRENPKVGRNEPCPCGSKKKYKKCCVAK